MPFRYNPFGKKLDYYGSIATHTHLSSSITDFTEASEDAVGNTVIGTGAVTVYYDDVNNILTISGTTVSGYGPPTDHAALGNLDYAHANHTGFQPAGNYATNTQLVTTSGILSLEIDSDISTHESGSSHDSRYYTEAEVDALTWTESDITDLDKYTQAEVTTISGDLSSEIDSDILAHAADHTQYLLIDGSRALTSAWDYGSQTISGTGDMYTTVLHIAETTTPTAIPNHGAVYTKSDNTLYFQDGAGVERALIESESNTGEMYKLENSTAVVVETANKPIMSFGYTPGILNNITYTAGKTSGNSNAITAFANYGGTVPGTVLVTDATHGLSTGDIISIRGATTAAHNGVF